MAKIVQHRRGTTSSLTSILGLAGEIFVDTSLVTIVVHDGVTTGGTRLARASDVATVATSSSIGTVRVDGSSILVTAGTISVNTNFNTSTVTYGGFTGSSVGQTINIAQFQTWMGNTSTLRLYGKRFNAASYDYGTASYNLQYNVDNVNYAGLEFSPQNYINGLAINVGANGSSQAVIIDGSGRMMVPLNPAFLASNSAGTHTTNANTVLDFNTAQLNRGNNYSTSTYAFTAPVAGTYYFYAQIYHQNGAIVKSFAWRKNGSELTYGSDTALMGYNAVSQTSDSIIAGAVVLNLAVNDYVQMAVRLGAQNVQWYGGHSTFFGYLIG